MDCPNEDALAAFARGEPEPAVEAHLDACTKCRETIAHLAAFDQDPNATMQMTDVDARFPNLAAGPGYPAGSRISRYVVRSVLGRGGMGLVLEADDPELDRRVAIKIVRSESGDDEEQRLRLLREARAMAKLADPHVVAVHDVGSLPDGGIFIAMELVRGTTLRNWAKVQPRTIEQHVEKLKQAGLGLVAAHARGLVHRDFKPENVLVGDDGRVRVTDFGLARAHGNIETMPMSTRPRPEIDLSRTGTISGTPAYMSPEQIIGEAATAEDDQYAFAITCFEALAGERPFKGSRFEEIAEAKLLGERQPWPAASVVPAHVRTAIDKGMSRERNDRHPSMGALLDALSAPAARHSLPVPGRRAVMWGWIIGMVVFASIGGVAAGVRLFEKTHQTTATTPKPDPPFTPARGAALSDVLKSRGIGAPVVARTIDLLLQQSARIERAENTAPETPARAFCFKRRRIEIEAVSHALDAATDVESVFKKSPLEDTSACENPPPPPQDVPCAIGVYARMADLRTKTPEEHDEIGKLVDDVKASAATCKYAPLDAEVTMLDGELRVFANDIAKSISAATAAGDAVLAARASGRLVEYSAGVEPEVFAKNVQGALDMADAVHRSDLRADALAAKIESELRRGQWARAKATFDGLVDARKDGVVLVPRSPSATTNLRAQISIENDDPKAAMTLLESSPVEEGELASIRGQHDALLARAQYEIGLWTAAGGSAERARASRDPRSVVQAEIILAALASIGQDKAGASEHAKASVSAATSLGAGETALVLRSLATMTRYGKEYMRFLNEDRQRLSMSNKALWARSSFEGTTVAGELHCAVAVEALELNRSPPLALSELEKAKPLHGSDLAFKARLGKTLRSPHAAEWAKDALAVLPPENPLRKELE